MYAFMVYVEEELRRLERESPPKSAYYRRRWREEHDQARVSPPRETARWLGDRLVDAGERLRQWAAASSAGRPPRVSAGSR